MSRIVPFANPAYALAGVRTPESTAMPTASTEAVRIGNAPTITETIVAAKIAKRCQAGGVSPSGTGQNQIADAEGDHAEAGDERLRPGGHGPFPPRAAEPRRVRSVEVHGADADLAALGIHDVLPGERERPFEPGETPRPARDRRRGVAAGADGLGLENAEDPIAVLVGEDGAADQERPAVVEADHLAEQAAAEPLAARQRRAGP